MANLYVQTILDAERAASELSSMGVKPLAWHGSGLAIEGYKLVDLGRLDHEWPDGDWKSEHSTAIISVDGALWRFFHHSSVQESYTGERVRRDEDSLTQLNAADLHGLATSGGEFKKIRDALDALI